MSACGHMASLEEELGQEPGLSTSGPAPDGLPLDHGHHWHAHPANLPPPVWSLPRAPLRSSPASFCTIVLTFIGTWKHCKNASVFSYMEIVAKKVLVWGKVISFLKGGEPSFSGGGMLHCRPE